MPPNIAPALLRRVILSFARCFVADKAFQYTVHGLTIYEAGNGFYIKRGKQTRGMSDGVDMLFDKNDEPLSPGTPEFYEALKQDLRANWQDYREAYFGL